MDAPSSRYKVVEQGRRLVVIDTWNGDRPVTRQALGASPARSAIRQQTPPSTPQQASAALHTAGSRRTGTGLDKPDTVITTRPWFDAKGPRRLKLDSTAQGILLVVAMVGAMAAILVLAMWGWPALLVVGFFLVQKKVRAGIRVPVTAWLDTQQPG